jgi:hypothetical protein
LPQIVLDSVYPFSYDKGCMDSWIVQGRRIGTVELDGIRQLMDAHPQWGRTHLSRHLAQQWNWRNGVGQLKDMAARTLLLKLARRGLLQLPPPRRSGCTNHKARRVADDPAAELALFAPAPISGPLSELLPLRVLLVQTVAERRVLSRLLQQHHYLGYGRPVGEKAPYLVESRGGQLLGGAVFGAAAWKCAARDRWIGWSAAARQEHLPLVANNMRLFIAPWVRVRHLASHLLSLLTKRVSSDWQRKYGHPICLLETFVEPERFAGATYRAANWIHVGQTQGRGRQGPSPRIRSASIKDVYLLPLHPGFPQPLLGETPSQANPPPP